MKFKKFVRHSALQMGVSRTTPVDRSSDSVTTDMVMEGVLEEEIGDMDDNDEAEYDYSDSSDSEGDSDHDDDNLEGGVDWWL